MEFGDHPVEPPHPFGRNADIFRDLRSGSAADKHISGRSVADIAQRKMRFLRRRHIFQIQTFQIADPKLVLAFVMEKIGGFAHIRVSDILPDLLQHILGKLDITPDAAIAVFDPDLTGIITDEILKLQQADRILSS